RRFAGMRETEFVQNPLRGIVCRRGDGDQPVEAGMLEGETKRGASCFRCQAASPDRLVKKIEQFGLFRFGNPAQAALPEQPAAGTVFHRPDAVMAPRPVVVEV